VTAAAWFAAVSLAVAALVAAAPAGRRRARQAQVLTGHRTESAGRAAPIRSILALLEASTVRATVLVAAAAGAVGAAVGGAVAATASAAYTAMAMYSWLRRRRTQRAGALRRRRLDELCALAADLRAGLPLPVAVGAPAGLSAAALPIGSSVDRLGELAGAARRLADETGAPLADLLDRIEADARAADRIQSVATAQAAGARATALLLATLPAAGIGLGYGMGIDPAAMLLHSPVGAGCAVSAIGLQIAGLAWSQRLIRIQV
jgi:tight adherence protein B